MNIIRASVVAACLAIGAGSLAAHFLAAGVPAPVPAPTPAPEGILAPLDRADRKNLLDFYAAMADIIVRDGQAENPVCKSTFALREKHRQALAMAFAHTGIVGKYPGLGERLDAYLLAAIGDTDVLLTPESRDAAARSFLSIK
jgi:hypothetical protein